MFISLEVCYSWRSVPVNFTELNIILKCIYLAFVVKTYLLCIHWWLLIKHRLTQCPGCWWARPWKGNRNENRRKQFIIFTPDLTDVLRHAAINHSPKSGRPVGDKKVQQIPLLLSGRLIMWENVAVNTCSGSKRLRKDSRKRIKCSPESLEICIVCAWLSRPKRPRHFLLSWYGRLKFLCRYSVGDSSMFSWSAYCWLKKPTFYAHWTHQINSFPKRRPF